jgi:hypothetical protein
MSTTVVSKQPTAVNPRPVIKKKKKTAEQQTGSFNKEKIGKKWRTRESINGMNISVIDFAPMQLLKEIIFIIYRGAMGSRSF